MSTSNQVLQPGGRVLFSATLVRGHIAKFHIPYLEWFKQQGWETWVAARNDYPDGVCEIPYCDHFVDIPFPRNPFSAELASAYRAMRKLFEDERFDIVHTHTPVGSVLTRLAARDARASGTKVLYTAHGFHFYDGAPLVNWLLWYPVEREMSRLTDALITINHEDYERAGRFAHCEVEYVPGVGVDLEKFHPSPSRRAKRAELGLRDDDFLILSVGDLIPRKNQQVIIKALAMLGFPFKLAICGEGPEEGGLKDLAVWVGVADRVSFLGFVDDMPEMYQAADALVFPSVHEGLPVSVIEAMASGCPVVASAIRGVDPDLVEDGVTGLLLRGKGDPAEVAVAVRMIAEEPSLAAEMALNAAEAVKRYDEGEIVREVGEIAVGGGRFGA